MTDNVRVFLEILTPCCLAAIFVINLLIKGDQIKSKLDLMTHQNKIKEELTKDNTATNSLIAVHIAEDNIRFTNVDKNFQVLERKLDKIDCKLDTKT